MLADLLNIDHSETGDEPIEVSDVKKQLEITDNDHDLFISELIVEARKDAEAHTHRSLIAKTLTAKYGFGTRFKLFEPPFTTVTSISSFYQGTETAEDTADFFVRSGLIPEYRMKINTSYAASKIDEIEIVYTAGYTTAPEQIKRAIIQRAADLFMARIGFEIGTTVSNIEGGDWKKTLNASGLVIPRA